jgi:hypothetical protein
VSCNNNSQCNNTLRSEEIITLMGIYREEWKYRDSAFMSTFLKFSLLSLLITFFPNLLGRIGFDQSAPLLVSIPPFIFSIFGILSALFGLFYSSAEAQRIVQIDNAYKRLMAQLPEDAQVKMLNNKLGNSKNIIKKFQSVRLNRVLYYAYLIPIGLAVLNFVLIILSRS